MKLVHIKISSFIAPQSVVTQPLVAGLLAFVFLLPAPSQERVSGEPVALLETPNSVADQSDSLAFQFWFTATAANVGYAYRSHDIGGNSPGVVDPELYTRLTNNRRRAVLVTKTNSPPKGAGLNLY
jgi:hypothetical protein